MALKFENMLFFHIPRSAGNYVRAVVKKAKIETREIGSNHCLPMAIPNLKDLWKFCTFRDPLSWYKSFWAYREKTGWRPHHMIDRHINSRKFPDFVAAVLHAYPLGWYSMLCERVFPFMNDIVPIDEISIYMADLIPETAIEKKYVNAASKNMAFDELPQDIQDRFTIVEQRRFANLIYHPKISKKIWRSS